MAGIAPKLLREQVQLSAAWAVTPASPYIDADPASELDFFRMQLAAHYTTLDTFVPTDVDSRIRFHTWAETNTEDAFAQAVAAVEEAHTWPVTLVSGRTVELDGQWLSGHYGEWNSIRAGALGRAIQMGWTTWADELRTRIHAEVARESAVMRKLISTPGRELDVIRAGALIAHNLGDVARVAEAWVHQTNDDRATLMALPGQFKVLGDMNRDLTANDNHRFLPLRQAKSLRASRELLLPTGPFFDSFGERIARVCKDPGEALSQLLEGHEKAPTEQGYQRAIAGLHQAHKGGVDRLADEVPARLRKMLKQGALRQALDLDRRRFEERMKARYEKQYKAALRASLSAAA